MRPDPPFRATSLDAFRADAAAGLEEGLALWRAGLDEATRGLLADIAAGATPCYVLGRNPHAEFIAARLPVAGFVDDFAPAGATWRGRPVLAGDALPAGAAVLNAVLHRRPRQALARLAALPARPRVAHYADFTRWAPARYPAQPFVAEAQAVLAGQGEALAALGARLADAESARVLRDVWLYRLTGDPAFTRSYTLRDEEQYFDLPRRLPERPVFVDGGAYRGETTEIFLRLHPQAGGVWLFEPNPDSLAAARQRLGDRPGVRFLPYALGEARERLAFDAGAANASRIAEEGGLEVEVVPLDEVVEGPVHFIKFDLEGFEPRALRGAHRLIREHGPLLAICVYHHPLDFLEVPRAVAEARDDYRLRLRHYTEGWEETVMYFSRD